MADPELNLEKENHEAVEDDAYMETGLSVLAGLNLALILSSLSLSDEEGQNLEEIEKEKERESCDRKSRNWVSVPNNIPSRRREMSEFKAVARQMAKANTKIRACRHGRKM